MTIFRLLASICVLVMALVIVDHVATAQSTANPCPDGQFADLSAEGRCRTLQHPEYGYQPVAIPDRNWTPSCSADDVQAALDAAADAGGGTVQMAACTFSIDDRLRVGSNTRLVGAGAERTVIEADGDDYLFVERAQNVILADFTFDGQRKSRYGIRVENGRNVLIERVIVLDSYHSNIRSRYSPHLTIRYSESSGARDFHGLDGKDCFGTSVDDDCAPRGEYWSFYSNTFSRNGGHGVDTHSSYGELAGNIIIGNGYGVKTPDAHDVLVWYNLIQDSDGWGYRTYRTYDDDADQKPYATIVERNRFLDNDTHLTVEELQRDGVHLVYNEYAGRGGISIKDDRVHGCPDSEDIQWSDIPADSPHCDGRTEPVTPTSTPTATKPGTVPPTPTLTPTATPFYLRCWELPAGENLLICERED